jgi:hypothetical protein
MDRIVITALVLLGAMGPAFAGTITIPEPATVTVFAVGAGGAYLIKRFRGRK